MDTCLQANAQIFCVIQNKMEMSIPVQNLANIM